MKKAEKVRQRVSETYGRAVSTPSARGCCGSPEVKGVAAAEAGYDPAELEALPQGAVSNSFGCGNPVALAGIREGDVVLDLGSGAGIDLLLAARKVGPAGRVIGVDMTDEMIAAAHKNIGQSGLSNIEVRKGLIEELPVADASVDWVISNCVINLSPDKSKVFAELARVLRPGGRISVADIVVESLPDWIRQSEMLYDSCVAGAISEAEYVAGLQQTGLESVEVKERLQYDAAFLAELVESELPEAAALCCGGQQVGRETLREIAGSLESKVWSARFYARKPA